jgi:RNA polymerase I-specific transcription initiation factor RRN3
MLRSMLYHLTPKRIGGTTAAAAAAGGDAPYDTERSSRVACGVVETVREILRLVPLSSAAVWQTFVDLYPHRRHDVVTQQSWLHAATQICSFAPGIREPILGAVVSRLLQMDVEVRVVDDNDDDAAQADLFFKLEIDPKKQTATGTAAATAPSQDEESNLELSTKLDALMDTMFEFFDERLSPASSTRDEDFAMLLDHFLRYVLPTYRSKATQFLVFRAASHSPAFVDRLLSALMRLVREEQSAQEGGSAATTAAPTVTRVAACAYIASFLARANFVSTAVVESYLRELLNFSHTYAVAVLSRHQAAII